jgi:hypothetical protein
MAAWKKGILFRIAALFSRYRVAVRPVHQGFHVRVINLFGEDLDLQRWIDPCQLLSRRLYLQPADIVVPVEDLAVEVAELRPVVVH